MNAMFATLLAILPYFVHAIYQAIQQELKKDYVLLLRLDGISNWELLKAQFCRILVLSIRKKSLAHLLWQF